MPIVGALPVWQSWLRLLLHDSGNGWRWVIRFLPQRGREAEGAEGAEIEFGRGGGLGQASLPLRWVLYCFFPSGEFFGHGCVWTGGVDCFPGLEGELGHVFEVVGFEF